MTSNAELAPADGRLLFLDEVSNGATDPDVVGRKAANLVRMVGAGLRVPPGFVLTTQVWADYERRGRRLDHDVEELVARGLRQIEHATGLRFAASRNPLLVSVRSGAP